jgi:hypothetical protein
MVTRIIGDIHGKYEPYKKIIEGCEKSIQVGDYGVGFGSGIKRDFYSEREKFERFGPHGWTPGPHRFIRGNHDNPEACRENPNWIPDGTIEGNVMFIGGALSIDKEWRVPNIDWWEDEEVSYNQFDMLISKAQINRPSVMITHDCPESIIPLIFKNALPIKSRTQAALDSIFNYAPPKLWIFGHWHQTMQVVINDTQFICLGELNHVDIDLERI